VTPLYPREVPEVTEHTGEIDELPVFWRSVDPPAGVDATAVPLYLHGVPDSSDAWVAPREHRAIRPRWRRWWRRRRSEDEWVEPPPYERGFLERTGGLALDLPGFGRTGKPGLLSYTIAEYDRFIERFLDERSVERVSIVMHDWGAVGLAFAQRLPERVERLVLINTVPLLRGYSWHRIARVWRTPGLGELAMGATNRVTLGYASRETNATPGPMPGAWLDSVLAHFDQGTQRAILRLYRSSPPQTLAAAGEDLCRLEVPALVVWGLKDPYIPAAFAERYASALPRAELLELPDAGHYAWLDRPEVIARVADFVTATAR
jgi:pimeloyl-ACP methyl ester carboxylesterase